MIKIIKHIINKTPIFPSFVKPTPVLFPIGVMAISAPKLNNPMPRINNNDDIAPILTLLFYYGAYMKEIEGPLTVKSKNLIYTNYRFYDEREYRYVPDYNELLNKGVKPIVDEGQYNHYKEEHGNAHLNISLPFTFNDLKIIIVKTDKQVKKLKKLFKEKDIHIFSHKEIKQSIIGKGHQITRKNISK